MVKLDELVEIIEQNSDCTDNVRCIAEYMVKNNYCCNRDDNHDERCDYLKVNNSCVKCWMIKLTDKIEEKK